MRKKVTSLALSILATILAVPAIAADASREGPPRNIILVGWDGARRGHVQDCLQRDELPTLKKLGQEGALVNIDVITGATDTKAGWTQILTGYNPAVTGVYSNGRFRDVPQGLSVFERLKQNFGPDRFVAVAVIGKSAHCGEIKPPFKKRLDEAGRKEMLDSIEDYRGGVVPRIVPVTLIRHHARRLGVDYLLGQTYLDPHPKELLLRYHV
jgi:hypothetical protein